MNGGNESSGADRAGGPVATSVPIGWQRCVREGAVLYIRYGSSEFAKFYPQALWRPESFLLPHCPDLCYPGAFLFLLPSSLSLFALCIFGPLSLLSVSSHIPYPRSVS